MASAKVTESFNCTDQEFFDLIADYESYPEFLSEVKEVKVLKRSAGKVEMEYSVSVIKTFKYKLLTEEKRPSSIKFKFISGDVFKSMSGSWTITPDGKKCKVDYEVQADFGFLVPDAIAKPLVSTNLPGMMANLKKRIKTVYGK